MSGLAKKKKGERRLLVDQEGKEADRVGKGAISARWPSGWLALKTLEDYEPGLI